jgi:tRNA(Ile)-lysidine synthase
MHLHSFDYLLTAHHADDNLETFLINLVRGTGLEGLKGIPEINDRTIRAILPFTKVEIEQYANENNLTWRKDSSNLDTKYLRNKIRHELIPILNELNPSFMKSFTHTLNHLKGSNQIVKDRIQKVEEDLLTKKDDIIKFDIAKLNLLSKPKSYLFELLKKYGFTEWNDVFSLLKAQSGKQVYSKTHRLIKDRDYLLLAKLNYDNIQEIDIEKSDNRIRTDNFELVLENINLSEEKTHLVNKNKQIIHVDKDLLSFPLHVRKWQKGDYFYPVGMQGKKKLRKYFNDEKLSLIDKEKIWLLCSENKIIWVINHRSDSRFSVSNTTKNILKIKTIT